MPDATVEQEELAYAVAQRIVRVGLQQDDSLFTQDRAVWTAENAEELYRRFVLRPLEGQAASWEAASAAR